MRVLFVSASSARGRAHLFCVTSQWSVLCLDVVRQVEALHTRNDAALRGLRVVCSNHQHTCTLTYARCRLEAFPRFARCALQVGRFCCHVQPGTSNECQVRCETTIWKHHRSGTTQVRLASVTLRNIYECGLLFGSVSISERRSGVARLTPTSTQRVEHRAPDAVDADHDPLKQLKRQQQEKRRMRVSQVGDALF